MITHSSTFGATSSVPSARPLGLPSVVAATCISLLVPLGLDAQAISSTMYTATVDTVTAQVSLHAFEDGVAMDVPDALRSGAWRPFHLRTAQSQLPSESTRVTEVGQAEGLPRLRWGERCQLIAYHTASESGFALLDPHGVRILASAPGDSLVPAEDGAFVSWNGEHLAVVTRGGNVQELWTVGLAAPTITAQRITVPNVDEIESKSVAIAGNAVFLVGEGSVGSYLYRVSLDAAGAPTAPPEAIAGPFEDADRYLAHSRSCVALLAGPDDDEWDLWIADAAGPARNLTRFPGSYVRHRPDEQRVAISDDGSSIAYNLDIGGEPEVFLHQASVPGVEGRVHVTNEPRFNPYIDQQIFIFFDANGHLIFDGGHSADTTDLFRIGDEVTDSINLTRTGSDLEPPFHTRGTLSLEAAVLAAHDVVVIAATGFDGAASRVLGVSTTDGQTLFESDLASARDFVAVGESLYFTALGPDGQWNLARVRNRSIETFPLDVSVAPSLATQTSTYALLWVDAMGLLLLEDPHGDGPPGVPRLVARGDWLPVVGITGDERKLVIGTPTRDGAVYYLLDLDTGTLTPTSEDALPGIVIAATPTTEPSVFLRGDTNRDGAIDISDPILTLVFLFGAADPLRCPDAADADDDGELNITDAIRSLQLLFLGGKPLPAPYPLPGRDVSPDSFEPCL